jgi:hypothetical protein
MFARLLYESFRRQKRRKLLAGIAITLGVAVATAMIAVATDIGDKISRELRSYGANLLVTPQEEFQHPASADRHVFCPHRYLRQGELHHRSSHNSSMVEGARLLARRRF